LIREKTLGRSELQCLGAKLTSRLRKRSPFCITVIILIAIRQRERTEKESELSRILQEQVERMSASNIGIGADRTAKLTFFSPVATLDTVQGLGKPAR
jgi:hypothetical protein